MKTLDLFAKNYTFVFQVIIMMHDESWENWNYTVGAS